METLRFTPQGIVFKVYVHPISNSVALRFVTKGDSKVDAHYNIPKSLPLLFLNCLVTYYSLVPGTRLYHLLLLITDLKTIKLQR